MKAFLSIFLTTCIFVCGFTQTIELNSISENENCNQANGSISLSPSNGTTPYAYIWNNGASTSQISNLSQGTYSVTVFDATTLTEIQLFNIQNINVSIFTSTALEHCEQKDGAAQVIIDEGSAPFSYQWSNGGNQFAIEGLSSGWYEVTVTDVAGCKDIAKAKVDSTYGSFINISSKNTNCPELNNGEAYLDIIGTKDSLHTILWSNESNNDTLKDLFTGAYFVTVTDPFGCKTIDTAIVSSTKTDCSTLTFYSDFTPNNDDINDKWVVDGIETEPSIVVSIFDRSGNLIYTSEQGYRLPWNGKLPNGNDAPADAYYYMAETDDEVFKGVINLIR